MPTLVRDPQPAEFEAMLERHVIVQRDESARLVGVSRGVAYGCEGQHVRFMGQLALEKYSEAW